jgi:hypothetical protein
MSVELTVRRASDGAPVDGLMVTVDPYMPAHLHGTSIVPVVAAEGQGRYRITQVDLSMAGHWELRTTFSGPLTDYVVPTYDIP